MPVSYITYALQNGYIHHWLVAGPQTIPLDNPDTLFSADAKLRLAQRYYTENSGVTRQPVEPGPLPEADLVIGDYTGRWAYTTCAEDHFVDGDSLLAFTDPDPLPHYARAWAYIEIEPAQAGPATLVLTTYGPADVWINDIPCYRHTAFGFHQGSFTVDLPEGHNAIVVRFAQFADVPDKLPHAFALRLVDVPGNISVQLPTIIEDVTTATNSSASSPPPISTATCSSGKSARLSTGQTARMLPKMSLSACKLPQVASTRNPWPRPPLATNGRSSRHTKRRKARCAS